MGQRFLHAIYTILLAQQFNRYFNLEAEERNHLRKKLKNFIMLSYNLQKRLF
jgi:hypothetical protein